MRSCSDPFITHPWITPGPAASVNATPAIAPPVAANNATSATTPTLLILADILIVHLVCAE